MREYPRVIIRIWLIDVGPQHRVQTYPPNIGPQTYVKVASNILQVSVCNEMFFFALLALYQTPFVPGRVSCHVWQYTLTLLLSVPIFSVTF